MGIIIVPGNGVDRRGEATPMEDEHIQIRWFPARQVEKMILSNKIQDSTG